MMPEGKRIAMALLVSALLVMAFIVGVLPSYDTERADASDGGALSMAEVLDTVLGTKVLGPPTVTTLRAHAAFLVPDTLQNPLWARFTAEAKDPALTDNLALVVDGTITDNLWAGSLGTVLPNSPYSIDINLTTLAAAGASHNLYAMTNVLGQPSPGTFSLLFDERYMTQVPFTVTQVALGEIDPDGNGLPDDPVDTAAGLQPSETWVYRTANGPIMVLADLDAFLVKDAVEDSVPVAFENVQLSFPSREKLVAAGVIDEEDRVFAVVMLAETLQQALAAMDASDYADVIGAGIPSERLLSIGEDQFAQYVDVSIFHTLNGEGLPNVYREVEQLPASCAVSLRMEGLDAYNGMIARMGAYPTSLGAQAPLAFEISDEGKWDESGLTGVVDTGALSVTLRSLSLLTPFRSYLEPISVVPSSGPATGGNSVLITNAHAFNYVATPSVALSRLKVYFGDTLAAYDTSWAGVIAGQDIHVLAPPGNAGTQVDVKLVNAADPNDFALLSESYTYQGMPAPTSITPAQGPRLGGTPVVISGTNMSGVTEVYFGTVSPATKATGLAVINATEVRAVTPSYPEAGLVSVFVDSPGGRATMTSAFHYTESICSLTTSASPEDKGDVYPRDITYYTPGTSVTVRAEAVDGWVLDSWLVNGVEVAPSTVLNFIINEDKTVVGQFVEESSADHFLLTVTVAPSDAGSVTRDPNLEFYEQDSVVTLTAAAAEGWAFDRWEVSSYAKDASKSNVLDLTMNSNKSVTAFFVKPLPSVEPKEAWLFGGIVARITGSGFTDMTEVWFGDAQATVIKRAAAEMLVIVPPYSGPQGSTPDVYVAVNAKEPGGAVVPIETDFLYKRYTTQNGVNITAFVYQPEASEPVQAAIRLDAASNALLTLPVLAGKAGESVYGLVRASKNPAALGTDLITAAEGHGATTVVDQIWDFDIHLYEANPALNTPALTTMDPVYVEVNDWVYTRNGSSAGRLDFPVNETGLKVSDLRAGLSEWSIDYDLDYVDMVTSNTTSVPAYQSTLGSADVAPTITAATQVGTALQRVNARLYDLSAFSLRKKTALPEDIVEDVDASIELDPDSHPTGQANGWVWGGARVKLYSETGGLGYQVDRVEFGHQTATKAWSGEAAVIVEPRADEFHLTVKAPKSETNGAVDIAVFRKTFDNTEAEPWVLKGAFSYKKLPGIPPVILVPGALGAVLAILGLGAAAAGIGAAGGPGGGGPCFIATAVYGTPMAPEIEVLRTFRDTWMLDNPVGVALVDAYYQISPHVADWVAKSPVLAGLVRLGLTPVIGIVRLMLACPAEGLMLALLGGLVLIPIRRRFLRRRG